MESEFRLFPEQASTVAGRVDALYLFLVLVSLFFTFLICFLILYFAVRYRRGRPEPVEPHTGTFWVMEVTWSVIPLILVMVMFGWGARLFFEIRRPPDDCIEMYVLGKQWMWKVQHPEGNWEINELHMPVGRPVRLRMISQDVIHSFYVPNFRVKMDVLPGRYTTMWFEATRTGVYHLFCAEYCGTGHAEMIGRVIVMEPEDYADWLTGGSGDPPEVAGERLFEQYRCDTCHVTTERGRCPPLEGVYGRQVRLRDGRTVVADEDYLRESILDPGAKVVAGYEPVMPTFRGQLGEEEIFQIVEYLKSLSPREDAPPEDGPEQE